MTTAISSRGVELTCGETLRHDALGAMLLPKGEGHQCLSSRPTRIFSIPSRLSGSPVKLPHRLEDIPSLSGGTGIQPTTNPPSGPVLSFTGPRVGILIFCQDMGEPTRVLVQGPAASVP